MIKQVKEDIVHTLKSKDSELFGYIKDLLEHSAVQKCSEINHHYLYNRLEHMILVAKLSVFWAHELGADAKTCARAAILHDIGQYGFGYVQKGKKRIDTSVAKLYAKKIGEPIEVQHAIHSHHAPFRWPRTREAYILILSDILAWNIEVFGVLRFYVKKFIASIFKVF